MSTEEREVDPRGRHRSGRRRDPAREAVILDAAAAVLAEVGYGALTFEAVARRAGAGRATLYRRWSSPAELVLAAVRSRLDEPTAVPDTGSLAGDLRALLAGHATGRAATKTALLAGLVHALQHDPELRAAVHDQLLDTTDTTVTGVVVHRAQQRGELGPAADPGVLTEAMAAQIYLRSLIRVEPLDDAWIEHTVSAVLVPVLTRPPAAGGDPHDGTGTSG